MRIAIFGTGYVGLVSGTCFADMGNTVVCVDVDAAKVARLERGEVPIYEPGLAELLADNRLGGRIRFTTDAAAALADAELAFICVGTPMSASGEADLRYVESAARSIGRHLRDWCLVVTKSTVPVGTAQRVRGWVADEQRARGSEVAFAVASNPEFLKEGSAIEDFMKPDRVVVGVDDQRADRLLHDLYAPFIRNGLRFHSMDIRSAEMTKYAANAMLATKISFINEIANICERVGADVRQVRLGVGADHRIGLQFLHPGCGYGGSCFPKDVRALVHT
ncbi:MAG: UDP-glucose/GDP-mannose dehydrogenase family protein, partial [Planctomycetes bacterium]|nr:UDP-glucose/GDP-mannose dehydrogenase family protein [Planctomycetota bacterium]